jgi:osmotically-inducible protein OsmY
MKMIRLSKGTTRVAVLTLSVVIRTAIPLRAAPSDSTIKFGAQNAVIQDPHMDTSGIQVEVVSGIVTLSGKVNSLASRKYAILEAQKIDGVLGVIDKLTVQPTFRWDTDIVQDVRHRLVWDPAIASESIRVACADGKVTLEGQVSSMSEKQEAELVACEVRGVRDVQDDLTVLSESGHVTLTGTVAEWRQRSEADRVAFYTAGVQSVDNRIQVEGYPY